MTDFELRGGAELKALQKRLTQAGEKGLKKDLNRAVRNAAREVRDDIEQAWATELPHRGGLAQDIAQKSKWSTKVSGGQVTLTERHEFDIGAINRGRLRHPVFGNRRNWVNQQIKPNIATDAFERSAPKSRREIERIVNEANARI